MIGEVSRKEPGAILQHNANSLPAWQQWHGPTGTIHGKRRMFVLSTPGYTSYKGTEIHNSSGYLDGNFVINEAEKEWVP